jgi:hypothetical protein
MSHAKIIWMTAAAGALCMLPDEAEAGWQGGSRRAKCVKPDSAITAEQQQSINAAVRGGTPVWHASGQVDQSGSSATTNQVLSQGAFDQAWIRYELCMALDNNHIDQETYNRLLMQSLQGGLSSNGTAVQPTASTAVQPTNTIVQPTTTVVQPTTTGAAASTSGTEWIQQIQAQTQLRSGPNYANMAAYGYTLMDVASTGLLNASDSTTVPLNLPNGYEYALMGVCDNDCSDLDLSVLKSGIELAVDTSRDDWPVVGVTTTGSGGYEVKVTMYQCTTTNCGYQLTVWRRAVESGSVASSSSTQNSSGVVPISAGQLIQGTLGSGDHTLPNGEWADRYSVSLQAGRTFVVNMGSSDIDTYIVLQSPSGATEGNDDCDGNRSLSCVGFVVPESGTWTIYATSYQGNDDGSYQLQTELR